LYCSKECFYKDKKRENRKCKYCGKTYHPDRDSRKFCSRECYLKHKKENHTVVKTCVGCGKEFRIRKVYKDRYNYCSLECKRKYMEGEYRKCETCGKKFWHTGSDIKRGLNRRHCSEECRRPPQINTCQNCGKEFRVVPSNDNKFCSRSCYLKYTGESDIEKKVRRKLEHLCIDYKQEYPIGNYNIDFFLPDYNIALEADGIYWHNKDSVEERDKRRDKELLDNHRYGTIRISGDTIRESEDLSMVIINGIREMKYARTIYK